MNHLKLRSVLAATCAFVVGASSIALADGAIIKGKINWEGKPYRAKRMKSMNVECKGFHGDKPPRFESVVTNENGTLRNVFVYVKNAPEGDYPVPSEPVVLNQKGCVYTPHVFGLRVGQKLEVHNSDPTAHNVHFVPKRNKEFNKSQPKKGLVDTITFKRREVMIPGKCDVHPWMSAYVGVLDHPFFGATGKDGTFELAGLPPGKYTVEAWHEKYGTKKLVVELATDEAKEIEFTYSRDDK